MKTQKNVSSSKPRKLKLIKIFFWQQTFMHQDGSCHYFEDLKFWRFSRIHVHILTWNWFLITCGKECNNLFISTCM